MIKEDLIKYPLPDFLKGRCSRADFSKWLAVKGQAMLRRDKKRGKPYAQNSTIAPYKAKIYSAVLKCGERDPYTGDMLAWELIGTWDTSKKHTEEYNKRFALLPTADHTDPDVFEFEICSWMVNDCKSYLTAEEFRALCKKVTNHPQPAARK